MGYSQIMSYMTKPQVAPRGNCKYGVSPSLCEQRTHPPSEGQNRLCLLMTLSVGDCVLTQLDLCGKTSHTRVTVVHNLPNCHHHLTHTTSYATHCWIGQSVLAAVRAEIHPTCAMHGPIPGSMGETFFQKAWVCNKHKNAIQRVSAQSGSMLTDLINNSQASLCAPGTHSELKKPSHR